MKPGRPFLWIGAVLLIVGLAPIASAAIAGWISDAHGCKLDESGPHLCIIAGKDRGELLAGMFVLGWLALLTIWLAPLGLICLIVGIVKAWKARVR